MSGSRPRRRPAGPPSARGGALRRIVRRLTKGAQEGAPWKNAKWLTKKTAGGRQLKWGGSWPKVGPSKGQRGKTRNG